MRASVAQGFNSVRWIVTEPFSIHDGDADLSHVPPPQPAMRQTVPRPRPSRPRPSETKSDIAMIKATMTDLKDTSASRSKPGRGDRFHRGV